MGGASAVLIRPETRSDRTAVATVTEAAFASARKARPVETIRASDGFVPELSLLADDRGAIAGHVLLSHADDPSTRGRVVFPPAYETE